MPRAVNIAFSTSLALSVVSFILMIVSVALPSMYDIKLSPLHIGHNSVHIGLTRMCIGGHCVRLDKGSLIPLYSNGEQVATVVEVLAILSTILLFLHIICLLVWRAVQRYYLHTIQIVMIALAVVCFVTSMSVFLSKLKHYKGLSTPTPSYGSAYYCGVVSLVLMVLDLVFNLLGYFTVSRIAIYESV